MLVLSGGVSQSATLSGSVFNNGVQFIVFGAGDQLVYAGGLAIATQVMGGGRDAILGSATNTVVSSGGLEYIASGGKDSNASIVGGQEVVAAGGTANGTVVSSGGTFMVFGSASGATLSSGGGAYVQSGAIASNTTVFSGGADLVQGGGLTFATKLKGGAEVVSANGLSLSAMIGSGGFEMVMAGGTAIGATISGGTLEIMFGASIGGSPVTFAVNGGGTLQLDSSLTFSGLVAGFGQPDLLHLEDLTFQPGSTSATWTQSGTSGTLAVTNGLNTADIALIGQYSTANFHVFNDGQGRTMVSDPPVVAQTDQNLAIITSPHQT